MPNPRKSRPPKRIHIPIPADLYDRLIEITGSASDNYHGRTYGALSQIVTLALRKYLETPTEQPDVRDLI